MHKQVEQDPSYSFPALGCALDQRRSAIGMGRKTGYGEHNRNKMDIEVAHCRWGKIRMCGNRCFAPHMSWSAAIHGAFGIIGRSGKGRFRFWSGHAVMMMLVHGAITMVYCHCEA